MPDELAWYAQRRAVYSGNNEVDLLHGGDELFPAMCQAIDGAIYEIWMATYIFHIDAWGERVMKALCDAARRGVRVRVVVDGFGSLHSRPWLEHKFGDAGVQLAVFSPVTRWWHSLRPANLRRLHQKLCVVDGDIGFVGGINIIDDRIDLRHGVSDTPRLDFAVRARGPLVSPIEYTARAVWWRAEFGRDWRAEIADVARSSKPVVHAKRLLRQVRLTPPAGDPQAAFGGDNSTEDLSDDAPRLAPVRAAFVIRDNIRQRRTIERSYIEAIRNARERVDIVCPYFYPGRAFRRVLDDAARRGVRVRLVLQGKLDYRFAGLAASVLYDELLARGVHIFEYMPAFLHAKVAVVDSHWATVGSSNIDPLSLLLNLEANVVIDDEAFVTTLADQIEVAVEASRPVGSAQVRKRTWQVRLQRRFVAWIAHAYLRAAGSAAGHY
ncbi:cardiolipin synthase ClsB [soil metagenome]